MLARPLGWRIAQSGDANTAWQSTCDSGPDQIGGQEGERDGHVDLAYTAPFSLRDAFRICVCASDKFIKPVAAAGNRCNQGRAGLRPYRTNMLRREPHRCKNLPPPRQWRLVPRDMKGVVSSVLVALVVGLLTWAQQNDGHR